jgi:hypothetical protein
MAFDLLQIASAAENRAKDDGDIPLVKSSAKDLDSIKPAFRRLQQDSKDAAANFQVGRLLCLSEGRWSVGLPLLAKASDPQWVEAATLELSRPADASGHAKVGDAWKALWERQQGPDRTLIGQRARAWYDLALSELPPAEVRGQETRAQLTAKAWGISGAPNLSLIKPFFDADASNVNCGFPVHKFEPMYEWDSGYAKGRWFMRSPGGYWIGPDITRFGAPFACQVIAQVVDPPTSAWDLIFGHPKLDHSHKVRVDGAGAVKVLFWDHKLTVDRRLLTHTPKSIKPHSGFDALLIVGRARQLDLYLNGLPLLARPVVLQHDIGPGEIHIGVLSANTGGGHIELKRLTVWPAEGVPSLGGRQ